MSYFTKYAQDNFRTITATKPGKCRRCGGDIEVGQRFRWAPGRGGWHLRSDCEAAPSEEQKAAAEERANNRYWERVDNYRELGYDPN